MTNSPAQISYRDGYKFQLAEPYIILTSLSQDRYVGNEFTSLSQSGVLYIKSGYAWDGATGTLNTPDILRGSLVHDALYQLMREGFLDPALWRDAADRELQSICIEDGMMYACAELVYQAVHLLGESFAQKSAERPVLFAPAPEIVGGESVGTDIRSKTISPERSSGENSA